MVLPQSINVIYFRRSIREKYFFVFLESSSVFLFNKEFLPVENLLLAEIRILFMARDVPNFRDLWNVLSANKGNGNTMSQLSL